VLPLQSFVKDVEDLGLHDSTTDRCMVLPRTSLPEDVKMPAWLKAYIKVCRSLRRHKCDFFIGCRIQCSKVGGAQVFGSGGRCIST
jgi:hypothetical protein